MINGIYNRFDTNCQQLIDFSESISILELFFRHLPHFSVKYRLFFVWLCAQICNNFETNFVIEKPIDETFV